MSGNIDLLSAVARSLGPLRLEVVFLGGAAIALHITDKAAPEVRPTDDVDCVVEVASRVQYGRLEEKLKGLGFKNDTDGPICRWIVHGIKVDVMPTDENILGDKNRWFSEGASHAQTVTLPEGPDIRVFSVPYLLATKIEAFHDRGKGDFLHKDMEDIVALLDGCLALPEQIHRAPETVRQYLKEHFVWFLNQEEFKQKLPGHVQGSDRATRILQLLKSMASSS
jgi:predicted nucleotidyltransferase